MIARPPPPKWAIRKSTNKTGPIITEVHWVQNSTGFGFLSKTASGNRQLHLVDLKASRCYALTSPDQDVTSFDIRDRSHFVYTALSPSIHSRAAAARATAAIVGTGRPLHELIFPDDLYPDRARAHDLSELWAVVDGHRRRIDVTSSGMPLAVHEAGQSALSLSPDGHFAITALAVSVVQPKWEALYPPPYSSYAYRIRAGLQDQNAPDGLEFVSQYALVDLRNSRVKDLDLGPIGNEAGWFSNPSASWSPDGRSIVLSNTFLNHRLSGMDEAQNRPCVVEVDLATNSQSCLEQLKGATKDGDYEKGFRVIQAVHFGEDSDHVTLDYIDHVSESRGTKRYARLPPRSWEPDASNNEKANERRAIEVSIQQSMNDPPRLIAADPMGKNARVIWDPNPWINEIGFGESSIYTWIDRTGRKWRGGLYKPTDYVPGKRFPLVIQTHGFNEREFTPSGVYPTAFAARELAAAGFVVLQIQDCGLRLTPDEGPCQLAGYESAIEKLAAEGLIDKEEIGIVGFSRTCYYVLEALTKSTLHFQAASITDGVTVGYMQYITHIDLRNSIIPREAEAIVGASPFGEGLQQWVKRSPVFNMDKVTTPLVVTAIGVSSTLFMWEPYSQLRHQQKPVDLIVLNTAEHVITNPSVRMASQGGTVDWFRFWLQGYEDPDPAKVGQYRRWEKLCDMQVSQNPNQPSFCVRTKTH